MSTYLLTPNMSLPVPIVGTAPGPDYANDIDNCLSIVDAHNHAFGSGVQITPAGLNIDTDLPIQSNNLTATRTIRFTPQTTTITPSSPDLGCIYESGVDLYYNDGSGNIVRITQSGGVAGSPGSIANLVSPASAAYVSGTDTFVWESAANTAANMDMGSIILRNLTPSSNGITISPPSALSGDYTLTLAAALPEAISFLSVDPSGNIASTIPVSLGIDTSNIAPAAVTLDKVAPANIVISATSGAGTNTSNTQQLMLTATITTIGRPVTITFQPDTTGSNSYVGSVANISVFFTIKRNGTTITQAQTPGLVPPGSLSIVDYTSSAGSNVYDLYSQNTPGDTAYVQYTVMVVREF